MTNVEKLTSTKEEEYVKSLRDSLPKNTRLQQLLGEVPAMAPDVYKKTSIKYATREYEKAQARGEIIPHGFYQILEEEINKDGLLHTLRKYNRELTLIAQTMNMPIEELKKLFIKLRRKNTSSLTEKAETVEARDKIRVIIRKFTAKYKETYIKNIIAQKNKILEDTLLKSEQPKAKKTLTQQEFLAVILANETIKARIKEILFEYFAIDADDALLEDIILATLKKNFIEELSVILNIEEPPSYEEFKKNKQINRLRNNYEPKLNKAFANLSKKEKELIIKVLRYKMKCRVLDRAQDSEEFKSIKPLIKRLNLSLLEEISNIITQVDGDIKLNDKDEFEFILPESLSQADVDLDLEYNTAVKRIKSLHNVIYKLYKKQQEILEAFIETTKEEVKIDTDESQVDTEKWLNEDKIRQLASLIDLNKLNNMSLEAFNVLKKLLIKEGLLWVYIAGNIDAEAIAKIINNFQSVFIAFNKNELALNIENMEEIAKKANLYDYVNDLMIGLVGIDVLTKVINYNQFSGGDVTKEKIEARLRKVVDLAVRSESMDKSSLPFSCDIKTPTYSLLRYHNNNPEIFTCGVDTKTCFFISVNENDFFFYSLLSKDGYVVKIVNSKNELVARASCFRKNNVLMINGIRCLNNKTVPNNQEELQEFKEIVNLIKLMARKMIEITSQDTCPIDYVVVNKAGILENEHFHDEFESINDKLFREPINVYGDEWERFSHLYDECPESMFQEVIPGEKKSFSTDFGSHYPALLIASRDNRALVSPRDISYEDQDAIYERPRRNIEEYIAEEVDDSILARINRIRALSCFNGSLEEQKEKQSQYHLLTSAQGIKNVILGDDWCFLIHNDGYIETIYARNSRQALNESRLYLSKLVESVEKGTKLFLPKKINLKKMKKVEVSKIGASKESDELIRQDFHGVNTTVGNDSDSNILKLKFPNQDHN